MSFFFKLDTERGKSVFIFSKYFYYDYTVHKQMWFVFLNAFFYPCSAKYFAIRDI